MNITRLTRPVFQAISDAELETWLRIDADQDRDMIDMLVASATEFVEGQTGRAIGLSEYRIDFDCLEYHYQYPLFPVTRVIKVEYRDTAGVLQPITDFTHMGSYIVFASLPLGCPMVTLEAGYTSPNNIAAALRHAIAVLVSSGYNDREEMSDQTSKTVARLCSPHRRIILS